MSGKGATFRALHQEPGGFIIPNPWDIGTARILAGMGFRALATTSAGLALVRENYAVVLERIGRSAEPQRSVGKASRRVWHLDRYPSKLRTHSAAGSTFTLILKRAIVLDPLQQNQGQNGDERQHVNGH